MLVLCYHAHAQPYPTRPIRLVVPYAPGGPTDIVGRIVAQTLNERLNASTVVDNRPGASGMLGGDMVAKAAPDGYTLLLCSTSTLISSPLLLGTAPYDARRDFAPITLVASIPYVLLVHPTSELRSTQDLIAQAKAKPGALNYGSAGIGSMSHLAGALLGKMASVDITHVPYKGSSLAGTDLIGGRLAFMFEAVAAGMPYVKNGRLRALGISTPKRLPNLVDIPAISETTAGYAVSTWHGICAPRGTPAPVVERLNRAIVAGINAPATRERLTAIGVEVIGSSASEFSALIHAEVPRLGKLVRDVATPGP